MQILKILVVILFICTSCTNNKNIKFAVCADVHQDIIHDAPRRIQAFVDEAKNINVDFIIQLGDFCYPKEVNKSFLQIWNSFPGPKYHLLGNHEMDVSSKQETMAYFGMKNSYYSFDQGAFHFIVLDPNFFVNNGEYTDYEKKNYFAHKETRATVPPVQINWLQQDLANTNKLVVIFSHQSLEAKRGINNQAEIRKVLEDANSPKQKVIACFSGHNHLDYHTEINSIHYIRINSMSDYYIGNAYQCKERFSEEINNYRPGLKNTLPYEKPVYAIVEIDPKGIISIKGKEGVFILPGPQELNVEVEYELSASVSDRRLRFK